MVFPQQIAAALEIIAAFDKHTYAILLAQMQSGKTGTFMLVLSEMIRLGKVEYGVIFSGNREIELKEQTKNQDEFFNTYADYLIDIGITDLTIIDIIIVTCTRRIETISRPIIINTIIIMIIFYICSY